MDNRLTELTQQLVRIPSQYPQEKELCDFLINYFDGQDYTIHTQDIGDGRQNIVVERGSGDSAIAFYAHIDTVAPTGTWKRDPHSGELDGDRLYGLGSYDMKAGMAAAIYAFETYEPQNMKVKLILCVDEENISEGAHALLDSGYIDDVTCIISPEPAFRDGLQGVTNGRMGRCVFDLTLRRESVHTAFYELDKDLNRMFAEIVNALEDMYQYENDRKQFIFVRQMQSEVSGMSLPHTLHAQLEASLIPPSSVTDVFDNVRERIDAITENYDGIAAKIAPIQRATPFLNPYEVAEDSKYLALLSNAIEEETGKSAQPYFRSSVGDDNVFGANGYTVLGIGPEGDNAHAPDEWVSIQSLNGLYDILINFLKRADTDEL